MNARRALQITVGVALIAFTLVFLKNAWASDDAYITFRSIEQLFAGNGPRWNPHERVQVFTSPLWFWFLCAFRVFSSDVFLNAMLASGVACAGMLIVLGVTLRDRLKLLLALALLLCSNGFFDYTTSGLGNALGYLLVALFVYHYQRIHEQAQPRDKLPRRLLWLFLVVGFALTYRHDIATLLFIPCLYVFGSNLKQMRWKWVTILLVGLFPFLTWSVFSLIYYGSLFPNTAYAKLSTGIPRLDLLKQGFTYIGVTARHDTATVCVLLAALIVSLCSRRRHLQMLGCGIALNIAYVIWVGGDFMLGRFFSSAYLLGVVTLMLCWGTARSPTRDDEHPVRQTRYKRRLAIALGVCTVLYAVLYPHTPVNSPLTHETRKRIYGIVDERGYYFQYSSLWKYITRDTSVEVFPDHGWARSGNRFRKLPHKAIAFNYIGVFGYWAGTEKIILDKLGLSDPLLARLPIPKDRPWRVGHYKREIPAGYRESTLSGTPKLADPNLNAYYKRILVVTRGKLFSWERIRTIIALNLGRYDHYLEGQ